MPRIALSPTDSQALVTAFRPIYQLHSEEMWYPCHFEDLLRFEDLVRVAVPPVPESVVIAAPLATGGFASPADVLLYTPEGRNELAAAGITVDPDTIAALLWTPSAVSPQYATLVPNDAYRFRRSPYAGLIPPYGFLNSTNFAPQQSTWFHRGAPNNPANWLGGDPAAYAPAILNPAPGTFSGATQEPTTIGWVQQHTVGGVDYVDVIYTCYLALNGSISLLAGQGEHPNDVETVAVRFLASDLTTPLRYYFQQHGGLAWYDASEVETSGTQVIVYLARQSHECYPHAGRFTRIYGLADDVADGTGVTWTPDAQYVNRPQGPDADAARLAAYASDPNSVVLVPLDDPGPLWQYVRFGFIGLGGDGVNDDFNFQGAPVFSSKWWPCEGPAATSGPLAAKAADPSAPGMQAEFFAKVSAFSAVPPTCGGNPSFAVTIAPPVAYSQGSSDTVLGSALGGDAAAQAPNATFVNWQGGIGTYITSVLTTVLSLPDPLNIPIPVGRGALNISVTGLSGAAIALPATGPGTLAASAQFPQLALTVSALGVPLVNVAITGAAANAVVSLTTPIAVPAQNPDQWYVPYTGPAPYSYDTAPFHADDPAQISTWKINKAMLSELQLATPAVTPGGGILDALVVKLLECAVTQSIAAAVLTVVVNGYVRDLFQGTKRVG